MKTGLEMTSRNFSGLRVEILAKTDDYLIVNKPFDLVINSDDETKEDTLHKLILNNSIVNKDENLHFVHRLDYATSGIICLARNKSTARTIGRLFQERSIEKYYIALLRGHVEEEYICMNSSIGYDKRYSESSKRMCSDKNTENCMQPRKALTKLLVLERGHFQGDPITKVLLKLLTGRRHQLRVHCDEIGHTILGDYTYSDCKDSETHRMYLHSIRLKIPLKDHNLDIITPDPFTEESAECIGMKMTAFVNKLNDSFDKIDNRYC